MFLTLLVIAHLHFTQGWTMQLPPTKPTVVAHFSNCHWIAPLQPQYEYCSGLQLPVTSTQTGGNGQYVELQPASGINDLQ